METIDTTQGKSVGDLGREALWFGAHTLIAIAILAITIAAMTLTSPNPRLHDA